MALTLFPAEVPHANGWYKRGGRALHVEFSMPWLERLLDRKHVLDHPADFQGGAPVWLAQKLAVECHQQDDVAPLAIEGLVLELLASCSRSQPKTLNSGPERWLGGVRALLQERFAENLSLEQIATEFHVSADHLTREFRRRYGCTVGDHLRQLRLDFARERLSKGQESLAVIALSAGFSDQSHFTRVFHRQLGLTPSAYRRLMKGHHFRDKTTELFKPSKIT